MTVVPLDTARRQLRPLLHEGGGWRPDEMAELMQFYAVWRLRHGAAGHAFGETEYGEPQFYILGRDSARPCLACVSRLRRDGYAWYLVEDGVGGIRGEGHDLGSLIERERGCSRLFGSASLLFAVPLLFRLLTDLDWVRADAAVILASQPDAVSPDGILWWTSQLFALA